MRSLLISAFFLFIFNCSTAQSLTPEQVDKQTYDAFFAKEYKTTIQLGNEALQQGTDFYFLRYRLGVSYYELKNYEAAIPHFEKTKELQDSDPVLLEYLYYSYVFTNRNPSASLLAETFSDELKAKINYKAPLFESVSVEVGLLSNPKFDSSKKLGTNSYARGTFYSDVTFGNIVITNAFSPKLKLYNNLSYVANTSNEIIQMNQGPVQKNNVLTAKNNYFQWNIVGSYCANNWTISAGFGLYNSNSNSYTLPPPFIPNGQITSTKLTSTNYSGSASISKRFKYIEPNISFSYANLLDYSNFTTEASATYYPFGNINFYGNTKIGLVSANSENNTIFTQLLGVKLSEKIWIEGFGAIGNHQNYISDNGLSVFNTPDKINWYAGSNLNVFLKNFDISLGYGLQEREASYLSGANPISTKTVNYTYNYNLLKTKITWKF